MNIVYSDKVHLLKLFEVPKSQELILSNPKYDVYEYNYETIGIFDTLEEAKKTLIDYRESNLKVFAYEIIGPEWRYMQSESFVGNDYVESDNVNSDDSPEYQLLFDSNKKLISSYFFDTKRPGGERVVGERCLQKGDKALVRISVYIKENQHYLLIPVIVEGKPTIDYLYNKWKKVIRDIDKRINGDLAEEPSDVRILRQIDGLMNFEKDSLVFKSLVSVKTNLGEEPSMPVDDAPRIDILPLRTLRTIY